MARLLFRDSQGREGTVELSPTETVYVGRGLECAIRTDDGMVSRKHAQFRMENGRFVVEDLGSANGTHLNNTRIQKQAIGHADIIQCGSLVIRFVDEGGVNIVPQQIQPGANPPPKKGGTMVLDRGDAPPLPMAGPAGMPSRPNSPSGFPPPAANNFSGPPSQFGPTPYGGPPSAPSAAPVAASPALPYGGPPQMPGGGTFGGGSRGGFGGSAAGAASPFGAPPPMPSGGTSPPANSQPPPNMPYGGPPAMPNQPGGGALPYGAPPVMPGAANPSMFGRGGPMNAPSAAPQPSVDPEQKVLVDLGLAADPAKANAEVKQLKVEFEKANANYEREVADGKRIRAESATLRERIEELRAAVKDREEQAAAHDRVADQLRDELQQTRDEYNKLRLEMGEMAENMAARERQAARAQEDAVKIREDMQDLNRQLMELSRNKDEGWKKLNEQLTEIDHLREVINEQERMLEERRVGLISQEEVIKELRSDKEKTLKQIGQLKAERDEAKTTSSRHAASISALEEENKRLGRLLVETQSDGGRGGQSDHLTKMTNDIREVRVELKRAEADRERLEEQYTRTERDREKLEGRLAQTEVELQEATHAKLAAESARNVAQDALAKAEVARAKAAEDALSSAKARDAASTGGDDARRELDKLRRKVADLEKTQSSAAVVTDTAEVGRQKEAADRKIAELTGRAEQAERAQKGLQLEIDAAKMDAQKARTEAARAKASADAQAESIIEAVGTPAGSPELARRAKEIYEAINDILSEMRNNMVLVQGELPNLKADGETMQAVNDAVDALVDSAETAKGALRGLRDLAENR